MVNTGGVARPEVARRPGAARRRTAPSARVDAGGEGPLPSPADPMWLERVQRSAGNAAAAQAVGRLEGSSASAPLVQRFAGPEHVALGDQTTPGPVKESSGLRYTEDPKDELTFGEVVAMAGDYFGSIGEMRRLAGDAAGREQLAYARAKVTNSALPTVSDAAKQAVDDRFFRLAAHNTSHFAAGGSAQESYEKGHMQAMATAWTAGHEGHAPTYTEAVQEEAFCNHYLTDLFSGGHIRTPRASVQDWYAEHFPDDLAVMKQWLNDYLVRRLNALNPDKLKYVPNRVIAGKVDGILEEMAGEALRSFRLGDLVGLAMHNDDNKRGVPVVSMCDPDGRPGEFHWIAFGDNEIGTGGGAGDRATTFTMAAAAARASHRELEQARDLGASQAGTHIEWHQLEARAIAAVNVLAPPKALLYLPREDVAKTRPGNAGDMSDGPLGDWRWGKFTPEMRAAFEAAVLGDVVAQINGSSGKIAEPRDAGWPVGEIHARQAVVDLAGQLGRAPLTTFEALFGPAS